MQIDIYTDGSTKGNGKGLTYGGWGYVILDGDNILSSASDNEINTTNQRMELTAAIKALNASLKIKEAGIVIVHTDSAYLCNCYKCGWYENWLDNGWKNSKRNDVANRDLWEQLIPFFEDDRIEWIKVEGHTGNKWNEFVDTLAQNAAAELKEKSR